MDDENYKNVVALAENESHIKKVNLLIQRKKIFQTLITVKKMVLLKYIIYCIKFVNR